MIGSLIHVVISVVDGDPHRKVLVDERIQADNELEFRIDAEDQSYVDAGDIAPSVETRIEREVPGE